MGDEQKTEEDRALMWWFGHTRQLEHGTSPVDSLVAMVRDSADARERETVAAIVAEVGATGPGDMGKVMGAVKSRLAGKADMGLVSAAVKKALQP